MKTSKTLENIVVSGEVRYDIVSPYRGAQSASEHHLGPLGPLGPLRPFGPIWAHWAHLGPLGPFGPIWAHRAHWAHLGLFGPIGPIDTPRSYQHIPLTPISWDISSFIIYPSLLSAGDGWESMLVLGGRACWLRPRSIGFILNKRYTYMLYHKY